MVNPFHSIAYLRTKHQPYETIFILRISILPLFLIIF